MLNRYKYLGIVRQWETYWINSEKLRWLLPGGRDEEVKFTDNPTRGEKQNTKKSVSSVISCNIPLINREWSHDREISHFGLDDWDFPVMTER